MGHFDDEVCELHALEGHGLSLHASARAVHQSLADKKGVSTDWRQHHPLHSPWWDSPTHKPLAYRAAASRIYPVLVNDIYDGHQLACVGSKSHVGHPANLDVALENLQKRHCHVRTITKQYALNSDISYYT